MTYLTASDRLYSLEISDREGDSIKLEVTAFDAFCIYEASTKAIQQLSAAEPVPAPIIGFPEGTFIWSSTASQESEWLVLKVIKPDRSTVDFAVEMPNPNADPMAYLRDLNRLYDFLLLPGGGTRQID